MNKIKGMYKSLTIWVNSIAAVVIPSLPMVADSIPQMQPYLTPTLYQWLGGVVVALNIALRFKTSKSLAEK